MKLIKAICWDMDGTLIDNHSTFDDTVLTINQKYGLIYRSEYPVGGCLNTLWSCFHPTNTILFEDWEKEIYSSCEQLALQSPLRPFVKDMLDYFYHQNIPQSCVSNSSHQTIEKNLTHYKIIDFFSHIIGRDQVDEGKPHPALYLASCKKHNFLPSECLAIEDSSVGIKSAKEAGMNVVAFLHDAIQYQDYTLADYKVAHISDLKHLFSYDVK